MFNTEDEGCDQRSPRSRYAITESDHTILVIQSQHGVKVIVQNARTRGMINFYTILNYSVNENVCISSENWSYSIKICHIVYSVE